MSESLSQSCSVMILAAGFGRRLAPLTDSRAKPVVPFLNRPLLDFTLDAVARMGFREVVVNLHHLPDSIRDAYRDESFGLDIHFSVEETILGTAGGPRRVLDRLGERVLLINGDIATTMSPGSLWEHHRESGAPATLALHDGAAARDYPGIQIDEQGAVTHIPGVGVGAADGRRGAAGCFAGIHIVERRVLELVPEGTFCGMVAPIYAELMRRGLPPHGVVVPGAWYEIGTPDRYVACQLDALRREDFPLAFAGARRVAPAGYQRGLVGFARAGLQPPYFLDRGVLVEEGASLRGVVAGRRARIGCGATIRDSVLLPGAAVGPGARLERCLVLDNASVAPGARIRDEVVPAQPVGSVV